MKRKLILHPLMFFSTGFLIYLIIPYLAFMFIPDFYEFTPIEESLKYMNLSFFTKFYFFDIFIIFISFYVGYKISLKLKLNETHKFDIFNNSTKLSIVMVLIIFSFLLLFLFRAFNQNISFFGGYKTFNVSFLGQFSTITFFTFFFTNFFKSKKIKAVLFIFILLEVIVLLGLGSRNIVVNGIITIILGYIYNNRKLLSKFSFYFFLFIFVFIVLFVGVWRTGYEYKIETFLGIFLAEPIFVLSSAATYLKMVEIRPVFSIPYEIILSIVNFIPTFIYSEKLNFISTFMDYKYKYSPFGASSIFVNLYTNFGYFYFIYVMAMGYFFGILYRKAIYSNFYRTVYFSIVPLLLFQFYNQYIYSLFKLLFWNGFILPYVLFFVISVLKKVKCKS